MDAERWARIKPIFYAAAERPADERSAFIRSRCDGDETLASEVESLLAAHDQAGSFIEAFPNEEATANLEDIPMERMTGRQVGPYKVISLIGRGGMGEVYLAHDSRLGRKVALKFLPASLSADDRARKRLIKEAQAAAKLDHPNICTIYEVDQLDGLNFIAMQYVEGETLACRIQRKPLEIKEVLDIAAQVADALAEAHSHAIIHRDIKPANIMMTTRSQVKVMDFGLAKAIAQQQVMDSQAQAESLLSEPGMILGTLPYMSPEQVRGEAVDARSDIFSFGVMLYEMASGHMPFAAESAAAIISAILTREAAPLARYSREAPGELERILSKALRKDREERYQGIKDLALDLKNLKEQLEFEAKLERSQPPDVNGVRRISTGSNEPTIVTRRESSAPKSEIEGSKAGSGAKLFTGAISKHKWAAVGALALVVTVSAAAFFYSLRSGGATINSMAVLPFVNDSADPDTEYLSDGITESLINSLSQLPNLRMIARTSAQRYKGRETDPQTVARELGVQAVLTGRVVRRGDSLSVSAELVDARDNSHIWGEQYNRRLSDILVVQQEIAREIAERLRARLTGEERRRVTRNYTENVQAYQLYLRGRHHWNKRTAESWRQGIAYFQQAIDLDPNYALAYSGLADCYSDLQQSASALTSETLPRARAAALRALELDPSLAEAHASLGFTYLLSWQWAEAERELKRAIELNPNYASARRWYGIWLEVMDRSDEALEEHRRAQQLDPLSPIISANLARIYMMRGELDSAINECRKITELNPDSSPHGILGLAYLKQERHEEAIAEFEKVAARNRNGLGALGYGYAVTGRRSEALAIVKELEDRYARREVRGAQIANIYAGLGDKDQAFAWLERDFQERSRALHIVLKIFPYLDTLRSDPRFADLLRRMGLPY